MVRYLGFVLALLVSACYADDVTVGFGDSLPPYCVPESSSGIEVDIFREALAFRGHRLIPVFLPIKRVAIAFENHVLDGAMMDSGIDLTPYGGLYATPAVLYDNVFITLHERHLKIARPEDLNGLTVLAFPGALRRYPAWLQPVMEAGRYIEHNDQTDQVSTLQYGRYDVVLSDRYIYRYYAALRRAGHETIKPVDEHDFVTPDPRNYRAIFRDPVVKADYEAGLQHLKDSGRYQAIYDSYLK
jgi:polar amino acid transport system substrate-binding protein